MSNWQAREIESPVGVLESEALARAEFDFAWPPPSHLPPWNHKLPNADQQAGDPQQ